MHCTAFFLLCPDMPSRHDVLNCKKCYYLRILAVVFWSSGLAMLSLLPNSAAVVFISSQDKILHFFAYLFTAWLACRTLQLFQIRTTKIVIISIVYTVLLGGILELLQQATTTTRQAEWLDFLANTIGAVVGCGIFCLQAGLNSRHHGN